jgi:L-fucose isomerase-like protein
MAPPRTQALTHTIRALGAARALRGARIGLVGGLAMTFYTMEVNTSALRARLSMAQEAAHVRDVVASVMGHGIEHHFVLIPGAHQAAALEFAAWTGMAPLRRRAFRDHLDAGDDA